MDIKVKKEILTELYNKRKLNVAQLCDLVDKNLIYDIIVFKYKDNISSPAIILDYVYGACEYNDEYRKTYGFPISANYYLEAILDNAERVYKALVDRNILSDNYRTYIIKLKGDENQ